MLIFDKAGLKVVRENHAEEALNMNNDYIFNIFFIIIDVFWLDLIGFR